MISLHPTDRLCGIDLYNMTTSESEILDSRIPFCWIKVVIDVKRKEHPKSTYLKQIEESHEIMMMWRCPKEAPNMPRSGP